VATHYLILDDYSAPLLYCNRVWYNKHMTHSINAAFESGVFRPLEKVELAEGARVVLQAVEATITGDDDADEQTRNAWGQFLDRMQAMPDDSPDDGLSNRDHDAIIYGG